MKSDPEHIAVSKSKGVRIDWKDGHSSDYSLAWLRDHCPCASCAGAHGAAGAPGPFQMYKPALKMENIEPVGNYAIRIQWNDGHNSGIYSWEHLRGICPCGDCRL